MNVEKKEYGVLMAGTNVLALLADLKTHTRRLVKPRDAVTLDCFSVLDEDEEGRTEDLGQAWVLEAAHGHSGAGLYIYSAEYPEEGSERLCPPHGNPGDVLWIREAWRTGKAWDLFAPRELMKTVPIRYLANGAEGRLVHWYEGEKEGRYRHARFMPRWMSRMKREVESVRIERLQDISEADAQREGVEFFCEIDYTKGITYRVAYRMLWESLNGPGSWDLNPWVWVYQFRQIPRALTSAATLTEGA